jgi:hypothetical protein
MRAKLIQKRNLFLPYTVPAQIFQQPRNDPFVRRRPRKIGERYTYAAVWVQPFSKRFNANRLIEGGKDGGTLIGQSGLTFRLNDNGLNAVEFDVKTSFSVC